MIALALGNFKRPDLIACSVIAIICAIALNSFVISHALFSQRTQFRQFYKNFWTAGFHVQTYPITRDGRFLALVILGNHDPYRCIIAPDLSASDAEYIGTKCAALSGYKPGYFGLPYAVAPHKDKVLVLGAGAGNEVAEALRQGASQVTAVEPERWLLKLGKLNPERPYSSNLVKRIVGDPREFLRRTEEKFDLIIIGTLDSHTALSPATLMRMGEYIDSAESFADARDHLNKEGVLAVSYNPVRPWHIFRLAKTLAVVFENLDTAFYSPFRAG